MLASASATIRLQQGIHNGSRCEPAAPRGASRLADRGVKGEELVDWPGIIKHSDDAELVYVCDQAEWDNDADLHHSEYDESDVLIDSAGQVFGLRRRENGVVEPEPREGSMSLPQILGLIKAHAACRGSCCVAKIYAPSIADAFRIVASLRDS
jgi:hypothetical protein